MLKSLSIRSRQQASPNWLQRLSTLDRAQRMRLGAGVAALLVAAAVAAVVMGAPARLQVLFQHLGDKDGGAVLAQLSQMNVPYKYSEGGGAIPDSCGARARCTSAAGHAGFAQECVAGFELMESNKFGMTQFGERLNFQRGLEGELLPVHPGPVVGAERSCAPGLTAKAAFP